MPILPLQRSHYPPGRGSLMTPSPSARSEFQSPARPRLSLTCCLDAGRMITTATMISDIDTAGTGSWVPACERNRAHV